MNQIVLIAHNIRSTHNVGALFRTAEGFGIGHIYCSGYTPYPTFDGDTRLPHISQKLTRQIHKTALGAELLVPFSYHEIPPIKELKRNNFKMVGLEQHTNSISISSYKSPKKIALLIGEEVNGIADDLLSLCETIIEIPMLGQKESFNVSVAAGIAMYHLRNY